MGSTWKESGQRTCWRGTYAFSRRERELIGRIGDPALAALVGWTVKEASWKALDGSGGPESIQIVALDARLGHAVVRPVDLRLGTAYARVGRIRAGATSYVLAVAWAPETGDEGHGSAEPIPKNS